MSIYAIADLHLAFGIPDKSMEYFGGAWMQYTQKIEEARLRKFKSIKPRRVQLQTRD
jgi:hypothetical protein